MRSLGRFDRWVGLAAIAFVGVLTTTCSSSSKPAPAPAASDAISEMPPPQQLWGEMKAVVSVRELMRDLIDPIADNIFEAVGTFITKEGTIERVPKTDADWDKVRVGAVTMIEASYLLKVPRPFTPPGDENNSQGPDAPELSPAQILAKLEHDPVFWNAKIEALRNVGLEVLEIVKKKDTEALWAAGEDLDVACETCHIEYWYPGQKTLMPKLYQRLQEFTGEAPASKP